MTFSVLLCVLVTTLLPISSSHYSQEARYECGAHGKFEYCIDDIPGCVIGCHCHPGYYFDTDSKICEPNIKLTQDFRRHYVPEPTRVYASPANYLPVTDIIPTPTTIDNTEKKVNEAAKDADELGDWLYNQFFKTIENQVIINSNNSTTNDKEKQPPTRRAGGYREPLFTKPKKRTRKSMRAAKKKKRVKGLRRKLLRITEDDSLFDSDSDSDDSFDFSDSYSDSDSDTDTLNDSSDNERPDKDKKDCKDDKDDHGHKKVIIFNRRPKPPLPSFIFLPSMDTPFYPPIGLPPPPPMPLYPMVPVPPMAPPMFPFQAPQGCAEEENNSTTSSPATSAPTQEPTTIEVPPSTTEDEPKSTSLEPNTQRPSDRRSRFEKHRMKKPMQDKFMLRAKEPGNQLKLTHGQRSQFVQKLRDKMKQRRKNIISPIDSPSDELPDGEPPIMDEDLKGIHSQEAATPLDRATKITREPMSKLDDVDFKYLSELIHRVNQSNAKSSQPRMVFNLNGNINEPHTIKRPQTRRNYDPYNLETNNFHSEPNYHRNLQRQRSDDVYYTNIGRQIATMIRNADSNLGYPSNPGNPETFNPEQANSHIQFHSFLNENNDMPRSFWERSVRSPLQHTYGSYLDESRTLKHSNDKYLLNLENAVEIYATTQHPLGLRDIENILNKLETARVHMRYKEPFKMAQPQYEEHASLNVNLLPKYVGAVNRNRRLFNNLDKVEYITKHYHAPIPPKIYVKKSSENVTNITNSQQPNKTIFNLPFNNDYWMYNRNPNVRQTFLAPTNKLLNNVSLNQIYNTNPTRRPLVTVTHPDNKIVKKPVEYLQFLRSIPILKRTTAKRPEIKMLTHPSIMDYHTLNYFTGNRHHYTLEEATYPLVIKSQVNKPHNKGLNPSYFHHALHHFDFFD